MGKSHVRHFVAEGARVVFGDVLDDKGERGRRLPGGLPLRPPGRDQRGRLGDGGEQALDTFGRLDVLVNNAGVLTFGRSRTCRWLSSGGSSRSTRWAVAGDEDGHRADDHASGGSIVNISSIEGFTGAPKLSAYSASKFAIRGMTKSAAQELGPFGIRVNSVHPGAILTSMTLTRPPRTRQGR